MAQENNTEAAKKTVGEESEESATNNKNMVFDGLDKFGDLFYCPSQWCALKQPSSVQESYNEMRKDGTFCDVTFLVGENKVRMDAHRVILAAFSEFFKTMFTTKLLESNQSEIELPYPPAHVEAILDLAYKSGVKRQDLPIVAGMSDYLLREDLKKQSETSMGIHLKLCHETALKVIEFADTFKFESIKEKAEEYFRHNLSSVARGADFSDSYSVRCLLKVAADLTPADDLLKRKAAPFKKNSSIENRLFGVLWTVMEKLSEEEQEEFVPEVLKAVHLPSMSMSMLRKIAKKVERFPEAKALMKMAKKKHGPVYVTAPTDPVDLWCLPRLDEYREPWVIKFADSELEVNTTKPTKVVIVGGIPLYFAATITSVFEEVSVRVSLCHLQRDDVKVKPHNFRFDVAYGGADEADPMECSEVPDNSPCKGWFPICQAERSCEFSIYGYYGFQLSIQLWRFVPEGEDYETSDEELDSLDGYSDSDSDSFWEMERKRKRSRYYFY